MPVALRWWRHKAANVYTVGNNGHLLWLAPVNGGILERMRESRHLVVPLRMRRVNDAPRRPFAT